MNSTLARPVTTVLLLVVCVDSMLVAASVVQSADDPHANETPAVERVHGERPSHPTAATPPISQFALVDGFDDVRIHIRVATDRSATWSVQYRYRLDDETTTRAFERVRRNVTNPPGVFIERMRDAARRAQQRTDRDMEIQNGTVRAFESVPHGRFGVVEYRFTWTEFGASQSDGRVVVGDVLDGYPLGENESLIFDWPAAMQRDRVRPSPNASSGTAVRWEGPHKFAADNPRLVLATGGGFQIPAPTSILLVALAVLSVVLFVYADGTERLVAAVRSRTDESESPQSSETSSELLSDEERVLHLLEANGGRMKQQAVKEELDWSRTKTSNVVNALREDDKIEVYRLGRENTLALPGEMDL